MRLLTPLRGRWTALVIIALVQAMAGLVLGAVAALPWVHVLRTQPDGVRALFAEGGRFALDVLHHQSVGIETGAIAALVGVGLWSALWFVLGGVMPLLFATGEAPGLHRTVAGSVRRVPTLTALAGMAFVGYAIAGVIAFFAWAHATHRALTIVNTRAADMLHVYDVLPAVVIVLLVTVWHDIARTHAMADAAGSLPAAAAAVTRMLRSPIQTLGRAAGYALLGALGPLAAWGASSAVTAHESTLALVCVVLVQQLAVGWRLGARALWFAWLASPWREGVRAAGGGRVSPRLDTP